MASHHGQRRQLGARLLFHLVLLVTVGGFPPRIDRTPLFRSLAIACVDSANSLAIARSNCGQADGLIEVNYDTL